jgi:class 3 adenylate cyclase
MLTNLFDKHARHYLTYSLVAVAVVTQLAGIVGVLLLYLYHPMSIKDFLAIIVVTEGLLLLDNIARSVILRRRLAAVCAWIAGDKSQAAEAWRIVAALPLDHVRRWLAPSLLLTLVPATLFITVLLNLGIDGFILLIIAGSVAVLYSVVVRYLGLEAALGPVLTKLGTEVPSDIVSTHRVLSLRTKMIILLPAVNIITAVVVAGLAAPPTANLDDLVWSIVLAVGVTFVLSSIIVLLLTQAALAPVRRLEAAGRSLAEGDLGAVAPPTTPDEAGALGEHLAQIAGDLDRGRKARKTLDRFVDVDVAQGLLEDDHDMWSGSEEDVTVLFCDLKGFSIQAAREPARETLERLRRFYRIVVPIIESEGGHANKFIGDGLMAIFGAPTKIENHADSALRAAEAIADQLRESPDLHVAIGLNSGRALVGTVAAANRLDFTVVGEVVNTAARIEALTRETGDEVLITEATRSRLSSGRVLHSRGHFEIDELKFPVLLWTPNPTQVEHK